MRTTVPIPVIAALALALGACGASEPGGGSATTATAKPAAVDPQRAVVSVLGIYADKKTQVTGVVFEAGQGLVLTANHAVEAAPKIDVRLADGSLTHGRAVARAQCHDLAVIKLNPRPPGLVALPLGQSSKASVGQPVTTLTYLLPSTSAGKLAFTRVQGTISAVGVKEAFPPLPPTGPFLAHQTQLLAPASGSPIVDARGRMLGFNTLAGHAREPDLPGIEYALTSDYIRQRLRELRPGTGGALGGWESEHDACHATLRKLVGLGHGHDPKKP